MEYDGVVRDVDMRAVRLLTFDGLDVILPAREVLGGAIVNHTRTPQRRTTLELGVRYDTDLEQARRVGARGRAASTGCSTTRARRVGARVRRQRDRARPHVLARLRHRHPAAGAATSRSPSSGRSTVPGSRSPSRSGSCTGARAASRSTAAEPGRARPAARVVAPVTRRRQRGSACATTRANRAGTVTIGQCPESTSTKITSRARASSGASPSKIHSRLVRAELRAHDDDRHGEPPFVLVPHYSRLTASGTGSVRPSTRCRAAASRSAESGPSKGVPPREGHEALHRLEEVGVALAVAGGEATDEVAAPPPSGAGRRRARPAWRRRSGRRRPAGPRRRPPRRRPRPGRRAWRRRRRRRPRGARGGAGGGRGRPAAVDHIRPNG